MKENYIMVTDFDNHWDKKEATTFPISMLKDGLTKDAILKTNSENQTIFIKIGTDANIQSIWLGNIFNINYDSQTNKISFSIKIDIKADELKSKYSKYNKSGWYRNTENEQANIVGNTNTNSKDNTRSILALPLLDKISKTTDFREFEDYTFYLLKLIGLNFVLQYPRDQQAGRADGFIKIKSVAILYDCTLKTNYYDDKSTQINNYAHQLASGEIRLDNHIINTAGTDIHNFVWIITKGNFKKHITYNNTKILEIPISLLIELYFKRLEKNFTEDDLENEILQLAQR